MEFELNCIKMLKYNDKKEYVKIEELAETEHI